jgi:thiol-disulfide isomerase/thioredoxin
VPRLQPSDLDGRPFVVKFHAQWCHVCRLTKDVWTDVEAAYSGRVNLVVFDFTNEETTVASRAEAERLGLTPLFQEYEGASGYVVIADGRTKDVLQEIDGSLDFAEYQTAIDAALKRK